MKLRDYFHTISEGVLLTMIAAVVIWLIFIWSL